MKRFSSSDSLGTTLYSPEEEKAKDNLVYSSEFQAMLDSLDYEGCIEESGHSTGKKRRLSIDQVQALEKIFEVDNKLDPERKVKLAQELGLQPRQVAIWFQNRRARWKTKQLERDYNLLKADYENLQLNYNKVEQEKQKMVAELNVLKEKLGEENREWNHSVATATLLSYENADVSKQCNGSFIGLSSKPEMESLNKQVLNSTSPINSSDFHEVADFKDGSSDSDSSGINELNNLTSHLLLSSSSRSRTSDLSPSCFSSSMYYPQLLHSRPQMIRGHQQHSVKMEELSLFSSEESCNIFSDDQAPNPYWYFPDQRS